MDIAQTLIVLAKMGVTDTRELLRLTLEHFELAPLHELALRLGSRLHDIAPHCCPLDFRDRETRRSYFAWSPGSDVLGQLRRPSRRDPGPL